MDLPFGYGLTCLSADERLVIACHVWAEKKEKRTFGLWLSYIYVLLYQVQINLFFSELDGFTYGVIFFKMDRECMRTCIRAKDSLPPPSRDRLID